MQHKDKVNTKHDCNYCCPSLSVVDCSAVDLCCQVEQLLPGLSMSSKFIIFLIAEQVACCPAISCGLLRMCHLRHVVMVAVHVVPARAHVACGSCKSRYSRRCHKRHSTPRIRERTGTGNTTNRLLVTSSYSPNVTVLNLAKWL